MGLAVALIMAIYLGLLVQGLVDAFILPLIEFALPPGIGWESFTLGPFRIGTFLSAFITFIIVAFVIFLLVKVTSRFGIE
jgi:large-conductance mechanosensitive channel